MHDNEKSGFVIIEVVYKHPSQNLAETFCHFWKIIGGYILGSGYFAINDILPLEAILL